MYTCKSQKTESLCNNIYFLLFFAKKKSRQKRLRLTKNAVLLLPRYGGAKKNSPNIGAEAAPLQFRLAQTLFGFIRLHSSKTCIFLRPVLPHLGNCTLFQISKYITKNKSVRLSNKFILIIIPQTQNHPIVLMTLAGTPATTVLGGTSLVTTAPAATTEFSPMVTPGNIVALAPIHVLRRITTDLR